MTLFLIAVTAVVAFAIGYRTRQAEPPEVVFRDCANPGFGEDDGHVWIRTYDLSGPVSLRLSVEEFSNARIRARNNAGDDPWANQ